MMMLVVVAVCAALFLINLWTYVRFWQDKVRAREGSRRIPELDLLMLALIGGSPGALLARQVFRHKTLKQPFSNRLVTIVTFQAAILVGLVIGTV